MKSIISLLIEALEESNTGYFKAIIKLIIRNKALSFKELDEKTSRKLLFKIIDNAAFSIEQKLEIIESLYALGFDTNIRIGKYNLAHFLYYEMIAQNKFIQATNINYDDYYKILALTLKYNFSLVEDEGSLGLIEIAVGSENKELFFICLNNFCYASYKDKELFEQLEQLDKIDLNEELQQLKKQIFEDRFGEDYRTHFVEQIIDNLVQQGKYNEAIYHIIKNGIKLGFIYLKKFISEVFRGKTLNDSQFKLFLEKLIANNDVNAVKTIIKEVVVTEDESKASIIAENADYVMKITGSHYFERFFLEAYRALLNSKQNKTNKQQALAYNLNRMRLDFDQQKNLMSEARLKLNQFYKEQDYPYPSFLQKNFGFVSSLKYLNLQDNQQDTFLTILANHKYNRQLWCSNLNINDLDNFIVSRLALIKAKYPNFEQIYNINFGNVFYQLFKLQLNKSAKWLIKNFGETIEISIIDKDLGALSEGVFNYSIKDILFLLDKFGKAIDINYYNRYYEARICELFIRKDCAKEFRDRFFDKYLNEINYNDNSKGFFKRTILMQAFYKLEASEFRLLLEKVKPLMLNGAINLEVKAKWGETLLDCIQVATGLRPGESKVNFCNQYRYDRDAQAIYLECKKLLEEVKLVRNHNLRNDNHKANLTESRNNNLSQEMNL